MTLYTYRIRLDLPTGINRGASYAENTHHATFDSEEEAIACLHDLYDLMGAEPMQRRWLATREGIGVHSIDLYRRSIENRRSWHHLDFLTFSLAPWLDSPTSVDVADIGGIHLEAGLVLREQPLLNDQRGAVAVYCNAPSAGRVRRVVYVGPLSPIVLAGSVNLLGFTFPGATIVSNPAGNSGDAYPPDIPDTLDLWRGRIAEDARDFVQAIRRAMETQPSGWMVIPSWLHGTIHTVETVTASYVRAHIRTRGIRGAMTPPAE